MFLGTIEPVVRNFLAAHADVFKGHIVAVGCSGNFTSERVLWAATNGDIQIFSNDVSLYSSMIGAKLTNTKLDIGIKEDQYHWLKDYLSLDGWVQSAAMMVFYRMLLYEKQTNPHSKRMWKQYKSQFLNLVGSTVQKLDKMTFQIAGYYPGDIFEHFKQLEKEHGDKVIYTSYMPFFKGGYEQLFRRLDQIFEWDEPSYPLIDDERRIEIANWCSKRKHVTLLDFPLTDQEPSMIGYTRRNKHVFMYSSVLTKKALYRRAHPDLGDRYQLVTDPDQVSRDSIVKVIPLSPVYIQPYKGLYLKASIDFSMGTYGFGISIDGRTIGFLEISPSTQIGDENWYLFSDFVVGERFHKREAKLVAMIALSREVQRWLESRVLIRKKFITTTAWTKAPVSMKYRSIEVYISSTEGTKIKDFCSIGSLSRV